MGPVVRVLLLARSLACKAVHTRARAYTHGAFAPARCVYLRRRVRRFFKAPLLVPRHRLKRPSAKIIKGGPASRWAPIDPVNSVTTTTLTSLNAEDASLLFLAPLSLLLFLSLSLFLLFVPCHLAIGRAPKGPVGFLNLIDRQ